MDFGNETPSFEYRFLDDSYFDVLLEKFIEAFSDYARPPELDTAKFRNHINLNAVDLNRSVGCFEGGKLIGFSFNGFGNWNGKPTVYDAGTGVIPDKRRRGASEGMFAFMVPQFKAAGSRQYLLEVITHNDPAVNLYKKLGFRIERELSLLEAPSKLSANTFPNREIDVRPIIATDLGSVAVFRDCDPSWQNSDEAVIRSEQLKTMLGAFIDDRCVGYIIFSTGLGRVAQFAVAKDFRGRGIGSRLLVEMETVTDENAQMQVINIDNSLTEAVRYLENRGFQTVLTQYEMTLDL